MTRSTPCIDRIEVKIASVGIGLGKSTPNQLGQKGLEIRQALAETAGGLGSGHISRFDAEVHHTYSFSSDDVKPSVE